MGFFDNNALVGGDCLVQEIAASVVDEHFVDFGLPSGTLWAKRNIGASDVYDMGDLFQWADPTPLRVSGKKADKASWKWYVECPDIRQDDAHAFDVFVESAKKVMTPVDDPAAAFGMRTPTEEQWEELLANTDRGRENVDGVHGWLLCGNGKSLFFPFYAKGKTGSYWTSTQSRMGVNYAKFVDFERMRGIGSTYKWYANMVRPVLTVRKNDR